MRIAYGLVVFLAACGNDAEMLPVGGGSGTGLPDSGMNNLADAHLIDAKVIDASPLAVDAAIFSGRVCLLTDVRDPLSCATTGANGLTVRLGANTAVTAADGTFKIVAGTGTWSVTGSTIVTSYKLNADYLIPAITTTMFDALKTQNNVDLRQGEGSLMIHVIHNGAGYQGATAASQLPNPAKYLAFYDDDTQSDHAKWTQTGGAGSHGMIWFAGIDVGATSSTVFPPASTQGQTDSGQPIADGAITWSDVIFN